MPQNITSPQFIQVAPARGSNSRKNLTRVPVNKPSLNAEGSRTSRQEPAGEPIFISGSCANQENPFRNMTDFISKSRRVRTFRMPEKRRTTTQQREPVVAKRAIRNARYEVYQRSRVLDRQIRSLYRNKWILQDQLIRMNIAEAQSRFSVIG